MKMKETHYEQLKNEILCLGTNRIATHRLALQRDSRVKDLEKRFRWDLLWATGQSKWITDVLYSYLNDTHIDTALRSIVKELD